MPPPAPISKRRTKRESVVARFRNHERVAEAHAIAGSDAWDLMAGSTLVRAPSGSAPCALSRRRQARADPHVDATRARIESAFASGTCTASLRDVTYVRVIAAMLAAAGCRGSLGDVDGPRPPDATSDASTDAHCDAPFDASLNDAATTGDAGLTDAAVPPSGPVLYAQGRRHSPITAAVAARIAAIPRSSSVRNVFAKVGDSITAMPSFATCFDHDYTLAGHAALEPTRAYFATGNAAGSSPYGRTSSAATGGWQTSDVLAGAPCPLQQEETALSPASAFVLLGTNDNRYGRSPITFGQDLWTIIDDTIADGTIPIMSTIPPVNGDPGTDSRVPLFNLIVRAIAQGRQVPLVDLHDELVPLANRGISSDGLHPSTGPTSTCDLTSAGLQYGFNVRNLISLEALDRVRAALAGSPPDSSAPVRTGSGSHTSPYAATLPLVDLADTRTGTAGFTSYACDGTTWSGRENVYRLDLASRQTLDAYVITRGTVSVGVHLLAGSLSSGACVASSATTTTATVGPGTVYIVVDTPNTASEGEYVLVVAAE